MAPKFPIDRRLLYAPGDSEPRPHSNCYWLVPGRILAGEFPGATLPSECGARIDALLDAGVRRCIDLMCESERPDSYAATLAERSGLRNVAQVHHRFAITDFGVPSVALMRTILDAIYEAMNAGETVYLHCWAGVGRTGTVVGCLLREQGLTAEEAIDLIAHKWRSMEKRSRYPRSPEWPGQFAFIESWTATP